MAKEQITPQADTFNGNFTAIPKTSANAEEALTDPDLLQSQADPGEMNESDSKESGYTDENGKAVDMAKKDQRSGH